MRTPARPASLVLLLAVGLGCGLGCGPRPPQQAGAGASASPAAPSGEAPAATGEAEAEAATPLVAIPHALQPMPDVVTGGVPSDAHLQQAKTLGYRTVVSVLTEAEAGDERARVEQHGLRFVSIPIADAADLTQAKAEQLGALLRDATARPLILHCGTGNRAGALLALEAFYVEHRPAAEALELGVKGGLTKLRPAIEQQLGLTPAAPTAPAP